MHYSAAWSLPTTTTKGQALTPPTDPRLELDNLDKYLRRSLSLARRTLTKAFSLSFIADPLFSIQEKHPSEHRTKRAAWQAMRQVLYEEQKESRSALRSAFGRAIDKQSMSPEAVQFFWKVYVLLFDIYQMPRQEPPEDVTTIPDDGAIHAPEVDDGILERFGYDLEDWLAVRTVPKPSKDRLNRYLRDAEERALDYLANGNTAPVLELVKLIQRFAGNCHRCRVCGDPLFQRSMGAPRKYCELHTEKALREQRRAA